MIRIDLMLAEYATIAEGKLFISGAGIDTIRSLPVNNSYGLSFAVGLTMKIPAADTGKDHDLRISITDSAGQPVVLRAPAAGGAQTGDQENLFAKFNLRATETMTSEDEFVVPLAFQINGVALPRPGVYRVRAEIDGVISSVTQFRLVGPPVTKITGRIRTEGCGTGVKFSGYGTYDLSDLKIIAKDNQVAMDIGDDVEVHDYGTVIE